LDSLNPLVPRLDLFHGSDHVSISVNNINEGLGCLIIMVLNAFHTIIIIIYFIGSVHYRCSAISRLYSWDRPVKR